MTEHCQDTRKHLDRITSRLFFWSTISTFCTLIKISWIRRNRCITVLQWQVIKKLSEFDINFISPFDVRDYFPDLDTIETDGYRSDYSSGKCCCKSRDNVQSPVSRRNVYSFDERSRRLKTSHRIASVLLNRVLRGRHILSQEEFQL